ncbi:MAG TPA: DNA polymerase IV [Firmicutes bacterium]|nr:DNA polymerase IV [Bacillota bacterium]
MRKIIHIDMDAFYASVEQKENPSLKGRPVIVGGKPGSRGVVCAASYEARKFGVKSAMASSYAARLCPDGIFITPHFDLYKKYSLAIHGIFHEYTDLVEPLSLDEAYLDVTENKKNISSAIKIAREIRAKIKEQTGLTASAGVSYNKFLAKIASDFNKPNGLTVVKPEHAAEFIDNLPIGRFHGIGRVTEKKMNEYGIFTGKDLKKWSKDKLYSFFGKSGSYYYEIARGNDNRPVETHWERKSLGREQTFEKDILNMQELIGTLGEIAEEIEEYAVKKNIKGRTITLKVKYFDFTQITRAATLDEPVNDSKTMMKYAAGLLLKKTKAGRKRIRLLGLTLSGFDKKIEIKKSRQLNLF